MCPLQIFSHLSRFLHILFTVLSKKNQNFGPIQIDIIVYIVSKVMSYDYAKFHSFIKKLTIHLIFR